MEAGRIDPERLRRDLETETFSTVVMYQDMSQPTNTEPELPFLPESQMNAIRKHYRLEKHIPGPYQDGVYVYKPNGRAGL